MLVLSRKENERIRIGDDIVITVVRTGGDRVRIGIEAPSDMVILRDELKAVETPSIGGDAQSGPDSLPFDLPSLSLSGVS